MSFTVIAAFCASSCNPACVVLTPSLSSMSAAVGPTIRLPCIVGDTRTPFPILVGSINTVWDTCVPALWSNRQYSPFLAVMRIFVLLTIWWILSAYTPAALTIYRLFRIPLFVSIQK